jgi:hypothetical protein
MNPWQLVRDPIAAGAKYARRRTHCTMKWGFPTMKEGSPLENADGTERAEIRCYPILLVVLTGILLPFTPFAAELGFVPLPASYFLFLLGATATHLLVVELGKRKLTAHLLEGGASK